MIIEPLESRIAPAGLVTITQTAADLKFLGDAEANSFSIEFREISGTVHVEATSGTMLKLGDQTATAFDLTLGGRKNLLIDLGAGADSLSLADVQLPGKLDIKGGAGNNTINLSGLMEEEGLFSYTGGDDADTITGDVTSFRAKSAKFDLKGGTNFMDYTEDACDTRVVGAFTVLGGSGSDTIVLTGGTGKFGSLGLALGAGANSSSYRLTDILVSGVVSATGLDGSDSFEMLAENNLTLNKTLTTNFGDGGGAVEVAAGEVLTVRGKSSFTFSKTQPSPLAAASVQIGGSDVRLGPISAFSGAEWFAECIVSISGYVDGVGADPLTAARSIRVGATTIQGATDVTMNASDAIVVRGSVGITAPDGGDVSITANYIDINGSVTSQLGAGTNEFDLIGDTVEISGKLTLGFGAGNATAELGATGGSLSAASVTMAKTGDVAIETMEIAAAGRMEMPGAFSILSPMSAVTAQFTGATLEIGKALTITLGPGADTVNLAGGSLSAKSLTVDLGTGANTFTTAYREADLSFASIKGGADADAVILGAETGIIPLVQIDLGTGANTANVSSTGGLRIGKLSHLSNSGPVALLDRLTVDGVAVKDLSANLGLADSVLNITRSRVGKLVANLGAGADTMRLDDNFVTGAVTVNTGFGNDSVLIEREVMLAGESVFLNRVIFTLSDGDDEALVADASNATKATFQSVFGFYGDAGTDTFTPHPTNAVFASPPVLTGTP